ncbi:hypothetical protein EYF80_008871 [Liparis tanakae]|uniref:Uncharacterized protein n=1 Tax=Liparis tanakae TaxID=230148 RepID=A0A4Z2ISN7_9TELE|nr:hypothetical protein EYF80_008871 [Liparis tanakae]
METSNAADRLSHSFGKKRKPLADGQAEAPERFLVSHLKSSSRCSAALVRLCQCFCAIFGEHERVQTRALNLRLVAMTQFRTAAPRSPRRRFPLIPVQNRRLLTKECSAPKRHLFPSFRLPPTVGSRSRHESNFNANPCKRIPSCSVIVCAAPDTCTSGEAVGSLPLNPISINSHEELSGKDTAAKLKLQLQEMKSTGCLEGVEKQLDVP